MGHLKGFHLRLLVENLHGLDAKKKCYFVIILHVLHLRSSKILAQGHYADCKVSKFTQSIQIKNHRAALKKKKERKRIFFIIIFASVGAMNRYQNN